MKWTCIACCLILALLFFGIGWVSRHMQQPTWFFALGHTKDRYPASDFTDISAFNHANSLMWFFSAALFFLLGVASFFFNDLLALELMTILILLQLPISFLIYRALVKRYRKNS